MLRLRRDSKCRHEQRRVGRRLRSLSVLDERLKKGGEISTFGFVAQLNCKQVGHPGSGYFCSCDCVCDIVMAAVESFSMSISSLLKYPKLNSPTTTVPGYVFARVMNDGPKVNAAGASVGAATV